MMHMAYVDWCPNAVVEGLVSGLPVLTTHNGGVPELIKGSGIIIKNEPDYNLEFIDHNNLPKLDPILVGEAIDILLHNRESFVKSRPDLTIENCGKQYLDFFKRVLS
jgi:glycosyltransferase involved in cell wall biosynthesis